jgi:anthranilate/para-aminobenzoate synthase component II
MSDRLIYVENDFGGQYGAFWAELGKVTGDRELFFANPQGFDLVCFTGGEDVDPRVYGHKNLGSGCSPRRDDIERQVFNLAAENKIPMTGICRGSQFLNVMNGGTMVQHLEVSHGGGHHQCVTFDDKEFEVTSSHHQMSVLGEGGIYLAWSQDEIPAEACVYDGDLLQKDIGWTDVDRQKLHVTESFVYSKTRTFAVQHHPEWQDINCDAAQWTLAMIRRYCFVENEAEAHA